MFKQPKEHTACLVHLTKNETHYRTFNPPKKYVKGKARNVEAFWGRMNGDDDFYINVWQRLSTSRFGEEEYATMILSEVELKDVVPRNGDALWIWTWKEERVGVGIVVRSHIEVERRKLDDEDIATLTNIRNEFHQAMIDDVNQRLTEEDLSPHIREMLLDHKKKLETTDEK